MKKWIVIALCAAMAFSLAACGADQEPDPVPPAADPAEEAQDASVSAETGSDAPDEAEASDEADSPNASGDSPAQAVNPFTDCATLEEAQTLSGLTLNAPDTIGTSTEQLFRAMEGELLEVQYKNGDEPVALVRKALGTEDISGDSTVYAQTETVTVDEVEVTIKGENDIFQLAIWNDGTYTYSVKLAEGLDSEGLSALTGEIL